ncbi:hypothetical protein ACHAQA_009009 [Verticillium albo-atrum]
MAQEKTERADAAFRPIAREACAIADRIRLEEKGTVWTPQVEKAALTNECIFPGIMFMLVEDRMESTKLWNIVRRMPKGSLLHAHMDPKVEFDHLIRELLKLPGMHISGDRSLTTIEAREDAALLFRYRKVDVTDGAGVRDAAYESGRFLLLTRVADEWPEGGREGFIVWLKGRCTLSVADTHQHHHGIDAAWVKFAKCFVVVATLIHYEPMFRVLLRRIMSSLKADGVNWAELRITWPLNYCREHQEEPEKDYTHMFQVFEEEIARFKASPEGRGFWGLRTIWTTIRSCDTQPMVDNMSWCITTKAKFPHLIAGYDLVSPEELGRPLVDALPELSWLSSECVRARVNLPFFFHAGETLGDGSATDANLFDAVLLGTRRIGHGFSLFKHPLLTKMVKEKSILVESCPISNEVLRLCGSIWRTRCPRCWHAARHAPSTRVRKACNIQLFKLHDPERQDSHIDDDSSPGGSVSDEDDAELAGHMNLEAKLGLREPKDEES